MKAILLSNTTLNTPFINIPQKEVVMNSLETDLYLSPTSIRNTHVSFFPTFLTETVPR